MARHETITNEFIAELNAGFQREAERVKTASNWPETQKRIVFGTHPYLSASARAEQGWSREEIERELGIQTGLGEIPVTLRVIGNRQIDEEES